MNEFKDKNDLIKIISQETGQSESTVDAFIDRFFLILKESIINNPPFTIEGLGTFRIIKNRNNHKTLSGANQFQNKKNTNSIILKSPLVDNNLSKQRDLVSINSEDNTHNLEIKNTELRQPSINNSSDLSSKKMEIEDDTNSKKSERVTIRNKQRISPYKKEVSRSESPLEKEETIIKKEKEIILENKIIENTNLKNNDTEEKSQINTFREYYTTNDYIKNEKKPFSSKLLVSIITILTVVAISFIIYLILNDNNSKENSTNDNVKINNTIYKELDVYNTLVYSYVVIPNTDTSIEDIAEHYYGDRVFWPYIYYANNDLMNLNFIVQAGSIIKIPRLTIDLVEYKKGTIQKNAERIGNQIRKIKTNN